MFYSSKVMSLNKIWIRHVALITEASHSNYLLNDISCVALMSGLIDSLYIHDPNY